MSDDQTLLLIYVHSRDAEAFAQLVNRYSAFVFSVANRVTGNTATAEDVTQDCFFALARKAASIRGSIPAWLHGVALTCSMQVTRNEARRHRHEVQVTASSDPDFESNWNQVAPLIDAALAKLPDKLREPLIQHFLLGHTQTVVAKNLGIDQATVSRRLHEGVERLREHLKQTGVVCGTIALSTALVKNASAAVPVKLTASLAKMALAGPVKIATTTSTAAVSSYGGINSTLIKGALTLMALTKAKIAIVAVGSVLVAATTATVIYENRPYPWQVENADARILDQVPPQVKIVPTIFSPGKGYTKSNGKALGMGQSITDMLSAAYEISRHRIVFSTKPPEDRYDFIANLPEGNAEAGRREIERQFNLTAKTEKRKTDVLLLTVKNRNAPILRPNASNSSDNDINSGPGYYRCTNTPLSNIAKNLERYFEIPVVDKTCLAGRFDINIRWQERDREHRNPDALKKVLLEELGLELVPGREMVEMLVVEKAH